MLRKKKTRRLALFLSFIIILSITCFFVLKNIRNNIVFFYTPTEIHAAELPKNLKTLRVGGLVKPGSITKKEVLKKMITEFVITDCTYDIKISTNKPLPNLFREKQGIVALGKFNKDNIFVATELLTKHSEVYEPPNASTKNKTDSFCYQKVK